MPRKATPLTDTAIKVAKPREKAYKLTDGQGLYLEVMPNGSKLWRLKYRYAGKEKRLAVGAYPAVPLQQARRRRDEAREQLAEGTDPGQLKKDKKQALQAEILRAEVLTFETIAREWHSHKTPGWAPSTATKALAYLESDILPALGKQSFESVTRPEVVALIRKIESRGAHNVAKKPASG